MNTLLKTTFVLALMVCLTGCPANKKKSGARFEDRGARAAGVTQRQAQVGVTTVVYGVDQNGQYRDHNSWMSSVRRLISASIGEEYIQDVSQDGTNKTGVFLGAKLCMNRYQTQAAPTQAMVVVQVYDQYDVPVPIYLNAVANGGGYNASTGQVNVTFADNYGSIRLVGQVSGANFSGWMQFDTKVRANGDRDNYGIETLGAVYMNADQLFSCY